MHVTYIHDQVDQSRRASVLINRTPVRSITSTRAAVGRDGFSPDDIIAFIGRELAEPRLQARCSGDRSSQPHRCHRTIASRLRVASVWHTTASRVAASRRRFKSTPTNGPTQVHNARSSQLVTHSSTNRGRRAFTSATAWL